MRFVVARGSVRLHDGTIRQVGDAVTPAEVVGTERESYDLRGVAHNPGLIEQSIIHAGPAIGIKHSSPHPMIVGSEVIAHPERAEIWRRLLASGYVVEVSEG